MATTVAVAPAQEVKKAKKKVDWKALPAVWEMIRPRRGLLLLGLVLVAINRVSGLVLPGSSKYLFDNVINKRETHLLGPIVLAVIGATLVQGLTSFTLTQLLSKSAQTNDYGVAQASAGAYWAAAGKLLRREQNRRAGFADHERCRRRKKFDGTGLVEFVGGLLTALMALIILLRISTVMTVVAFLVMLAFAVFLNKAFSTIRPIFRARPKINAEVTGQANRVAGRGASGEGLPRGGARGRGFRRRSATAAGQRAEDTDGDVADESVWRDADGDRERGHHVLGSRQVLAGTMTTGQLIQYSGFLVLLVAPVFQIVAIGTQITEAITGLERTREILNESMEDQDPNRTVKLGRIEGRVAI